MFIRNFKSFQRKKRTSGNVSESVEVRDDKFIVGGIVVTQTMVNKYKTRIKKETGKDANQFASDKDIAETLTNYLVNKASDDIDSVPLSALLGGEDGMSSEVSEVGVEESPVDVEDDGMSELDDNEFSEEEVSDDVFDDEVSDDDFESALPEDDSLPEEEEIGELSDELDDEIGGDEFDSEESEEESEEESGDVVDSEESDEEETEDNTQEEDEDLPL